MYCMMNELLRHNTAAEHAAVQKQPKKRRMGLLFILPFLLFLFACQPATTENPPEDTTGLLPSPPPTGDIGGLPILTGTPLPTRPQFSPGELVDYKAQDGDTLPALAAHFNTTEEEILQANPIIPKNATTLPPGLPMQIPIYYAQFWGTSFQILPDSAFINGPALAGFDTAAFIDRHEGWLKGYQDYVAGENRTAAEIIDYVAENFSISPRILLALLEYQLRALSSPAAPDNLNKYPLGYKDRAHHGLYLQIIWAVNTLNNGYYGWRTGHLKEIEFKDGSIEHPDPWQNAATVALQVYFSRLYNRKDYQNAISPQGFSTTYWKLFGNPWEAYKAHIPGSLQQPVMQLPFEKGKTWAFTGGPHTGWGKGEPFAALDFAPPSTLGGCTLSREWVTALASGVVARVDTGVLELDLDGDGDTRTGWTVLYLHIASRDKAPLGKRVHIGEKIGHPSCEGGTSTGTHIHIVRKYNGEWIPADGPLAFNLEGWIAHNGAEAYQGTLTRFSETKTACVCSNRNSQITAGK